MTDDTTDLPDQGELIAELFDGPGDAWLVIADAGRDDYLRELLRVEMPDAPTTVYNGGHTNTTAWFAAHFPDEYPLAFFNGGLPMKRMQPSYDEFAHFAHVDARSSFDLAMGERTAPAEVNEAVRAYTNNSLQERLADLGYAAGDVPSSGVVRYMAPHRPYGVEGDEIPRLSREGGDAPEVTATLIEKGRLSREQVRAAYDSHYEIALLAAQRLAEDVDGRVVLTSDHGELLGEDGLWYHGVGYEPRPELTEVPWVVLS